MKFESYNQGGESSEERGSENVVEKNERFPNRVVLTRECDSLEEYKKIIDEEKYTMTGPAANILYKLIVTGEDEKKLTLVKVTGEDFGLTDSSGYGYTANEMLAAAKEHGLKACPRWVVLQSLLTFGSNNESVGIGMEPIDQSSMSSGDIFHISRSRLGTKSSLGTQTANTRVGSDNEWLFVLDE